MTATRSNRVMADVAKLAGVSVMTVSRVLNDYPGVRPETRQRVENAIAELGYRANTAARALAGGRSGVIGVVSVETPYFGPSNTLFGIEAAARARDHFVSFVTLRKVDDREMQAALDHLGDAHVDGAIVIAPSRDAVGALTENSAGLPLVVMCGDELPGWCTAAVDQREGARLATGHLLDLGHRTVHHVRGRRRWIDADARVAGWRDELRARGVPVPPPLAGDWTARSGYRAGQRIAATVATESAATAVFVANDQMAVGVLLALTEAGLRVPDDVSVVGFDDTPESAFLSPPLTTVRQNFAELGKRGVELLLAVMAGHRSEQHLSVQPELVIRRSSGPPPGA